MKGKPQKYLQRGWIKLNFRSENENIFKLYFYANNEFLKLTDANSKICPLLRLQFALAIVKLKDY